MEHQAKIINKVLVGDNDSFRLLVDYYYHKIFVLTRGFVHNIEDAEDLTQETFINAFISLGNFKGKSDFSTWLTRIAINTTYSFLRKKKQRFLPFSVYESLVNTLTSSTQEKKSQIKEREGNRSKSPYEITSEKQINEIIYKEIDMLPMNQRTAFVLSRIDEMSQKEIAIIMDLSVSAVDSLIQRAKRNLKEKLKLIIDERY